MTNKQKIENLSEGTLSYCRQWVKKDDNGNFIFVDPIDNVEISAHYGATHAAAAFILFGLKKGDDDIYKLGINLLGGILQKWNVNKKLNAFHFDFNNFALCVAYDAIEEKEPKLSNKIKKTVLSTPDSNHDTINWLPMRWYVNRRRYNWTKNLKYKSIINHCRSTIKAATNNDGGIEDVLPKGTSFNLQYDVATASILQFLRIKGEEYDLSKELGFLINATAPDGDINYQGRGTNQIFGWSNWIYLLSSSGKEIVLQQSLDYIYDKVPIMLSNRNIMLNEWDGSEKFLWWDYHYCSVYTAHFLFWLMLSIEDYNKKTIDENTIVDFSSGLKIFKTNEYFVSLFEGRKKYLAEQGPIIVALWTKSWGTIIKASFAPWQGMFGNNYSFSEIAIRNFFGLLEVKQNRDWNQNRWIRKFVPNIHSNASVLYKPLLVPIEVEFNKNEIVVHFINASKSSVQLNIPSRVALMKHISVDADNENIKLHNVMNIRDQYSMINIFQTNPVKAKHWIIKIFI